MNTVAIYIQPYLDTYNQCYKNIVTINSIPKGPLAKFVKKIQFNPLSEFKNCGPCNQQQKCGLALTSLNNGCHGCDLMIADQIPDLFSFLLSNGYKIDTSLTKMMNTSDITFHTNNANKLVCFVTHIDNHN